MPGSPRIGLEIVDVRDLADVHVRAMISPKAAGQRFLATGECTWMRELARSLRDGLGAKGAKVSTRQLPDVVVQLTSIFDKSLRSITVSLDCRNRHSTEKAKRVLGWEARPAARTVLECANSLLDWKIS
jgi:nucleoside-diphosphate-sugar epimerase